MATDWGLPRPDGSYAQAGGPKVVEPPSGLEMIVLSKERLQALFDLAVESVDFGSGFWDTDETNTARAVANILGVDPMEATPWRFTTQYPHRYMASRWWREGAEVEVCKWCHEPAEHQAHHD